MLIGNHVLVYADTTAQGRGLRASGGGRAKGRRLELRPLDRSRCAEHVGEIVTRFRSCARPTGGGYGLTIDDPAQRFKGAKRRPRCRRISQYNAANNAL
jgi:hypothetical protein